MTMVLSLDVITEHCSLVAAFLHLNNKGLSTPTGGHGLKMVPCNHITNMTTTYHSSMLGITYHLMACQAQLE